jgi:hypothetical protein
MNSAIELLGYGVAVPAVIALAIVGFSQRFLATQAAGRYGLAVALAAAFFAGYALLPSWASLVPQRHWHWLPYLGAGAMVLGPVSVASGISAAERWVLHLLLAIVAACLLVPAWPNLQPPRSILVIILAAYLFFLMALADALPERLLGTLFLRLLCVVTAATAILIAVTVSLRIGQVAGIAAAALLGCCVLPLRNQQAVAIRGLIPAFAVIVGGAAFAGSIEPQPPKIGILLASASILGLWACAWGPLTRLRGVGDTAAECTFVLVPLAVVGAWALFSGGF